MHLYRKYQLRLLKYKVYVNEVLG